MEPQLTREEIDRQTFRWDRLRGAANGVTETCWQTFAILVAIRVFQADESIKQFIPAGMGIGFMLSPLGLSLFNRLGLPIASVISRLWILVALALAGMALSQSILAFVACVTMAQITSSQGVPLMTHLYGRNYPSGSRGSRFSSTFVIGSLTGIGFGFLGGRLLDQDVGLYPLIFWSGMASALVSSWAIHHIPSEPAHTLQSRDPFHSMVIAWQDKLFRMMLAGWMLMGLGSLMMIPIRVEYLANPLYGINASNAQIGTLLISTVLVFRLLSTKFWGALFDKVNVVTLRMVLNLIFVVSIILFFFTDRIWLIAIGCALLGVGFGGGGILWSLYVTKLASPDKVAAYMSVHGSTTGLRTAVAPFIGYTLVQYSHPAFAAWIALLMIALSTLVFLPLRPLIDAKAGELGDLPNPRGDPT